MTEERKEIHNRVWSIQGHVINTFTALSTSCIAFSTYQTMNDTLTLSMMPLGVAVLCWMYAIYCAVKNRMSAIVLLKLNDIYLQMIDSNKDGIYHEDLNKKAFKDMNEEAEKGSDYYDKVLRFFAMGVVAFICWRVWDMLPVPEQ